MSLSTYLEVRERGLNNRVSSRILKAEHKNFVRKERSGKKLKWKNKEERESRVKKRYQLSCCSTSVWKLD